MRQLMDSVSELLAAVEKAAGKTVVYLERPDLAAPAYLQLTEASDPRLELCYQPGGEEGINYSIANQAVHLLRFFSAAPAERFVSVANRRTMAAFIMETEGELERLVAIFGRDKVRRLIARWYQGVVFQLTRMPADIMVNKWLYDHCPELRPLQLQDLAAQRQKALQSLSPEVRRTTPARIFRAANIMNFVFFKNLEDHFHGDFTGPYHATIFILDGADLARITGNRREDNHAGDRAMIDAWAATLGLNAWYEWQPYETFSARY